MGLLSLAFQFSHVMNVIMSLLVILATLVVYQRSRVRLVLIVTLLFLFWGLTNVTLILPIYTDVPIDPLSTLNAFASSFAPALFLIFVDNFEGETSPTKTAVAVSIVAVSGFLAIAANVTGVYSITSTILYLESEDLYTMRWSPIASLALFPPVLMTAYWLNQELSTARTYSTSDQQATQISRMRVGGLLMFLVGPIFGILGVVLVELGYPVLGSWASEIIGYLFVSLGILVFAVTYLSGKEIALLLPQRIESVLIIHQTGLPVFTHSFVSDVDKNDLNLASGAITAIKAIFEEAFAVRSDIESIRFHEKDLILTFRDNLAFLVVAGRISNYLRFALDRFADTFLDELGDTFDADHGTMVDEKDTQRIMMKSFGFSA